MGAKSKVLSRSSPVARSAKTVIDAAIEEGARWEQLSYLVAVVTGLILLGVIVAGAVMHDVWIAMSGAIGCVGIIVPLIVYTNRIRRDKIRIRLYEITLVRAKDSQEAIAILREILDRPSRLEGKRQ